MLFRSRRRIEAQFHGTLLQATHNEYIASLIPLVTHFLFSRSEDETRLTREEHSDYVRIHREIIEALEKRDTKELKRCMTRHTENYLEILYGAMAGEAPKADA